MTRAALAATTPDLAEAGAVEVVVIKTTGDAVLDRPLAEIGGKGLFTKEIEEALLARTIDMAVHSMKDVPTALPPGLVITAMLPREDPRDALIAGDCRRIADLPEGAVIGTASLRRAAQLLVLRPDLA
jgi:hydroxymethylbilane synthase